MRGGASPGCWPTDPEWGLTVETLRVDTTDHGTEANVCCGRINGGTVYRRHYTEHSAQYPIHDTQYTLHIAQYNLPSSQFTLHST